MRRQYSLTSTTGPPSPAQPTPAPASSSSPSPSSSSSSSSSYSAASPRRLHPHFFVSVIFTLHLSRYLRRSLDGVCTYAQTTSFFSRPAVVNTLRSEEEALCRVLARVYRKLRLQKDTARGIQVLAVEFLRGESLTLQSIAQNASESMIGESMDVIRKALDALVEAILGFHEDGSVKGHGAEEGDTRDDYVPPMDETFYDARCRCALRSTIADVSHRHADAGDGAHAEKCSAVDGRCDDGDVVESLLQSIESKRLETLRLVLEKRNADETRVKKEEERMRELNLTKRENSIAADATRPPSGSLTSKPDTRELRKSSRMFRYISVGAAAVAGGIAVGLTGGLAAPAIAASIGSLQAVLGAGVLSTSAASLGTMLSSGAGVATVYGAFGVAGASVVGGKVSYLLGDVQDFVIAKVVNESEEDEDGADEEAESKDDAETTTSSEDTAGQGGARSAALSGHASEVAGERETDANTNNFVEQMREPTKDNEDAAPATPPQLSAAAVLCISGWLEADGSATAAVKAPEGGKEGNAPGEEAGENTQTDPSSDYFVAEEGLGLAPEGGEMDDGSEGTAPQDTTASSSPGPSPAPLTQLASSAAAAAASAATAVVVATTGSSKKVNRRVGYMRPWVSVRVQGWDRLCLEWEEKELAAMSNGMSAYLSQSAVKNALAGGAMHTVLAGVVSALAFPVTLIAAADVIDNAWSVINHRVEKVADVLAHLITKRTGWSRRPLSLIGFGLGAKIIFKACENLHARGMRGAIEHCILIGAPVTSSASAWSKLRAVSAGRLVNVYSESDWIIKLLHRDGVIASGAAGLKPVGVDETHLEVENVDAAAKLGIYAQSDYAGRMEDILTELGVGSPSKALS